MGWRKKEIIAEPAALDRLLSRRVEEWPAEGKIAKGFVPMLVGEDGEDLEKILVHVKLLGDPRMANLMQMAAEEFGFGQRGIIRVPCDSRHFQRLLHQAKMIKIGGLT